MSADKLAKLVMQRGVYINCINESCARAEAAKTDASLKAEIKARYADVLDEFAGFRDIHNQIIGLTASAGDAEFDKQDEIRAKVTKSFYKFKTIYVEFFDSPQHSDSISESADGTKQCNVRLPKLELKTFSGNLHDWNTFFDIFNSLIHNNTSLSNIDKFQYLISVVCKRSL